MLDLIEKKPNGIMVVLDEEIFVPKGSDATFLLKIHKEHGGGKHPNYFQPLKSRTEFVVNHYAGDVTYESTSFLEKNKDTLNKDLIELLEGSGNSFLAALFPREAEAKTRKVSLGGQFRNQLNDLMKTLNSTEPHYIRCVKPNPDKAAGDFRGTMVLEQLRYAGVFEAVQIRQSGYPFRYTHEDFVKRYGFMAPSFKNHKGNIKAQCKAILTELPGEFSACQIGNTRVLYRAPEHRTLELLRNVAVEKVTIELQAWYRRILVHKMVKRLLELRPILRQAIRARTIPALAAALQEAADASFEIKEIIDAKRLKALVEAEERITERIQDLMPQNHETVYDQLKTALHDADEINFNSPLVQQLRQIVIDITNKRECRAELADATEKADRPRLEAALARATELGIPSTTPVVQAARAEVERITKEERIVAALDAAMAAGMAIDWDHSYIDVSALEAALNDGNAFGCRTKEGVRRMEEGQLIYDIRTCLYNEDWKALGVALKRCVVIKFNSPEVSAAQDELSHKTAVDDVLERLTEGIAQQDQETLAYALEQADRLQMQQDEVVQGRQLLEMIIAARAAIAQAVAAVDETLLAEAVGYCDAFNFNKDEVIAARDLLTEVIRVKKELATGLHYFEYDIMEKAVNDADAINFKSDTLEEVRGWLYCSKDKFLQQQLKTANKLHDPARAIRIQIKMKDLFFETHGKMFVFKEYGNLRNPEVFAKAKLFGREKLKYSMMNWTKVLKTRVSLTHYSLVHSLTLPLVCLFVYMFVCLFVCLDRKSVV